MLRTHLDTLLTRTLSKLEENYEGYLQVRKNIEYHNLSKDIIML